MAPRRYKLTLAPGAEDQSAIRRYRLTRMEEKPMWSHLAFAAVILAMQLGLAAWVIGEDQDCWDR